MTKSIDSKKAAVNRLVVDSLRITSEKWISGINKKLTFAIEDDHAISDVSVSVAKGAQGFDLIINVGQRCIVERIDLDLATTKDILQQLSILCQQACQNAESI